MKVFSVCGVSQSGKTTTAEKIIRELRSRGYRVGSVKEIHFEDFAIDPDPDSNTRRHRMAGAGLVTARGIYETDLLFPGKLGIEKILSFYEGEYDWVVMEGVPDASVPVVVTARTMSDLKEKWSSLAICVSGRIAAQIDTYHRAPAIDAGTNAAELVDFLETSIREWPETFVFRSKRNKVLLRGGIVEKHLTSDCAAEFEAAELKRLCEAGLLVPKLLSHEGNVIRMSYINGETLPDMLTRLEEAGDTGDAVAPIKFADEIIRWFDDYYKAVDHEKTGIIRGDVNGRNFVFNNGHCWGLDFEEQATGHIEQDIGRLIAYVLTYDPPGTAVKTEFADRLRNAAAKTFGLDITEVERYCTLELDAMSLRRAYPKGDR